MSNWKADLAQALQPANAQAGTCEQNLISGLTEQGQKLAAQALQAALDELRGYLDCKFGGNTQQAQAAFGEISEIVMQCGVSNLKTLFSDGLAAYIDAVKKCVIAKLLGNIGGGIFTEKPVGRC